MCAVGGITLAGVAAASPTSTTSVSFVALNPAHKVLSAATIAANKTSSPVVAGGATTVPTNATAVQLTVIAKGAAGGVLNFYPAQNVSGGSGQSLPYPSGSGSVSTTIQENIGQGDALTFANASSGSVVVTATITGYSTQVTAGTINGTGGTTGQVLTNTGTGTSWQNPPAALPPNGAAGGALTGNYPNPFLANGSVGTPQIIDGSVTSDKLATGAVTTNKISASGGSTGQVLTNTGTGASWMNLPAIPFGTNPNPASPGTQSGPCTLGQVLLMAGTVYPTNWVPASGQLLSINTNNALYTLFGTNYGGNGTSNFALPNLQSAAPNGTTYLICVAGVYP